VYTGSNWNILSFLMALIILVPVAGLLFAWLSYGTLWTGAGVVTLSSRGQVHGLGPHALLGLSAGHPCTCRRQ
jgi:hypothetical protein